MDHQSSKSFKELLAVWAKNVSGTDSPVPPTYTGDDVLLTDLVEHSANVKKGACFVARVRTGTDGHPYIEQAIENGAALIIGQRSPEELDADLSGVPYLQVEDSALTEAWLAAAWYSFPARELIMTGVTGTDGKTTTVNILFNILQVAGIEAGMLSTLRASVGRQEEALALHVTTPESPVVQRYLRRMVDAGMSHCVLEVTSHGLAQERVGAISFDVAVVTNITHEHLDYHGDYNSYLQTKARLLRKLRPGSGISGPDSKIKRPQPATAVLNRDDDSFKLLADIPVPARLAYGLGRPIDQTDPGIYATQMRFGPDWTRFRLEFQDGHSFEVSSALVGPFNVYNMLAAAGAAHALGVRGQDIQRGLESLDQLTGRMQAIDKGQPFQVIVDFAHTPNALGQAIQAGKGMADGRLITVFGSAGKRDVEKRRLMAELSGKEADLTVLTAEDPRTESLDEILEVMAQGCRRQGGIEGKTFWRVADRGQAIYFALTQAQPGDLVLICGKGHEQSMCFGTTEYPWDDVKAAETALEAFLAGIRMPDLGLPTFSGPSTS